VFSTSKNELLQIGNRGKTSRNKDRKDQASTSGVANANTEILDPEVDLILEENFQQEDQKGIYGFTEGVVDPNAF
jgi:hypothetical protein